MSVVQQWFHQQGMINELRFGFSFLMVVGTLFFSSASKAFCFNEAAEHYGIHPNLLIAIAITESGLNEKAINRNRDKKGRILSTDYSLMQINDLAWFDYFNNIGVSTDDIKNDPCINVFAGAHVLHEHSKILGKLDWDVVGSYNVGFRKNKKILKIKERYISLVKKNFEELGGG